jgi:replicative DNA helicase
VVAEALVALHEAHEPIGIPEIESALRRRDTLKIAGGIEGVGDLARVGGIPRNVERTAQSVRTHAQIRRVRQLAGELYDDLGSESSDPEAALDSAAANLSSVLQRKTDDAKPIGGLMESCVRRVLEHKSITAHRTRFTMLDSLTDGLAESRYIVIAARPSMGKTALALNIADDVSDRAPVLVISLEQPEDQMAGRVAASRCEIAGVKIARGQGLKQHETSALMREVERAKKARLDIVTRRGMSIDAIRAQARGWALRKARNEMPLIVLDYIQRAKGNRHRTATQAEEISTISGGMAELALELRCPVLVLAQLSRGAEDGSNRKPRLGDLKGSGSLEEDADQVCLLWRESRDSSVAELDLAKNRHGSTGMVPLVYRGEFFRFENAEMRR